MRMYDIITHKRSGAELSDAEIDFFVSGFTSGTIPDYQAAALLMAVYFKGLNPHETAVLTDCMARSGDMADLSSIPGVKVDKHSTGGVGDKTSLIVGPIVASCGVKVAKMSGRGLGHTGGTVDKLESIPGLQTEIDRDHFFKIVNETGVAIIGQSGTIAPADKKLYALRDTTATVDNVSLIASSIMSKKLACGSDAILLDVKTGSGAFMKTLEQSVELAQAMVSIGLRNGKNTMALITDMDAPLGNAIGNALEIIEVVETLQGRGPKDLTDICVELAGNMLELARLPGDHQALAREAIASGKAYERLLAMVQAQGGDPGVLRDTSKLPKAAIHGDFTAPCSGCITHMNAEAFGIASLALGAGRATKEDEIDHSAGIILTRKPGDKVEKGEVIAKLYTSKQELLAEAGEILAAALTIGSAPPDQPKTVLAKVSENGVTYY